MKLLFEDESIIVAVKPQGIISEADKNGGKSMVSELQAITEGIVYPVHRLDKETGGVMVYAKSSAAAAFLSRETAEHKMKKQYLALVHGTPEAPSGVFCDLLFRDAKRNKSYVVKRERRGVKSAELHYEILEKREIDGQACTLVKIELKTGRTHQIRVQFSSRGMPLLGDKRYGARDESKNLALWAYSLEFTHPKTKKRLSFEEECDYLNS